MNAVLLKGHGAFEQLECREIVPVAQPCSRATNASDSTPFAMASARFWISRSSSADLPLCIGAWCADQSEAHEPQRSSRARQGQPT